MNTINELVSAAKLTELYCNPKVENIVTHRGNPLNCEFLFIGEAPGFEENKQGLPFVGKSGQILDQWIKENGIRNYCIINTVPIIPLDKEGKIRKPTPIEVDYFRPHIKRIILEIKPKYIILVGRTSTELFKETEFDWINTNWKYLRQGNMSVTFRCGFIYHPAYYLRLGQNGKEDFKRLIEKSGWIK